LLSPLFGYPHLSWMRRYESLIFGWLHFLILGKAKANVGWYGDLLYWVLRLPNTHLIA
jgi:hypothetical protein